MKVARAELANAAAPHVQKPRLQLRFACSDWLSVLALAQVEEDQAKFLKDQEEFKRSHRASWEIDVKEKQRLKALADDKAAFEEAVKTRRAAEFAALQVWQSSCHWPAAFTHGACPLNCMSSMHANGGLHSHGWVIAPYALGCMGTSSVSLLPSALHGRAMTMLVERRIWWRGQPRLQSEQQLQRWQEHVWPPQPN